MADTEQQSDRPEASQEADSITKAIAFPPVVRADAFLEVYANYVSFVTSPWDMTVMFGRTVADDPNNPRVEQRVAVSLSPQTAKAMAHMLLDNLRSYERQYGEIRYTPLPKQPQEPSA